MYKSHKKEKNKSQEKWQDRLYANDGYYNEIYDAEWDRSYSWDNSYTMGSIWKNYGIYSVAGDANETAMLLNNIKRAVNSIALVHGVPDGTRINIGETATSVNGCAGFEEPVRRKGPFIELNRTIFDEIDKEKAVDVYCGVAIHEASHLNHTTLMFEKLDGRKTPFLAKSEELFYQLLEDERIEQKAREDSPGYSQYLHTAKVELIEKKEIGEAFKNWDKLPEEDKVLALAYAFLRVPYLLSEKHKEFKTDSGICIIDELQKLLPNVPKTEKEVENFARSIYELCKVYTAKSDEEYKKYKEAMEQLQSYIKELMYNRTHGEKENSDLEKRIEQLQKQIKDLLQSLKGRFNMVNAQHMMDRSNKITGAPSSTEHEASSQLGDAEFIFDPDLKCGRTNKQVIYKMTKTPKYIDTYNKTKSTLVNQIRLLRRMLDFRVAKREYRDNEKLEGKLNRQKLGKATIEERLFFTSMTRRAQGLSICILLDQSGSMGGYSGYKAKSTHESAILLAEALKTVPNIELEIYAHTTSGSKDDILITHLYGKKNKNIANISEYLKSTTGFRNNYDSEAIRRVGKKFLQIATHPNKLMIVVSDGAPSAVDYGGRGAVQEVKDATEELHRKGVDVMQIAIESSVPSEQMFRKFVTFTDMNSLAKDIGKLMVGILKTRNKMV